MDFCDERAGCVDGRQFPGLGLTAHWRGNAVRRKDQRLADRHIIYIIDKDRALVLELRQITWDVVHDFMEDVHRLAEETDRVLDRLDRHFDASTESAGVG